MTIPERIDDFCLLVKNEHLRILVKVQLYVGSILLAFFIGIGIRYWLGY